MSPGALLLNLTNHFPTKTAGKRGIGSPRASALGWHGVSRVICEEENR
jgi:hypothetical protein